MNLKEYLTSGGPDSVIQRFKFPNGLVAEVRPDNLELFRFEVKVTSVDGTHDNRWMHPALNAALTSEQVEARLAEIAALDPKENS